MCEEYVGGGFGPLVQVGEFPRYNCLGVFRGDWCVSLSRQGSESLLSVAVWMRVPCDPQRTAAGRGQYVCLPSSAGTLSFPCPWLAELPALQQWWLWTCIGVSLGPQVLGFRLTTSTLALPALSFAYLHWACFLCSGAVSLQNYTGIFANLSLHNLVRQVYWEVSILYPLLHVALLLCLCRDPSDTGLSSMLRSP